MIKTELTTRVKKKSHRGGREQAGLALRERKNKELGRVQFKWVGALTNSGLGRERPPTNEPLGTQPQMDALSPLPRQSVRKDDYPMKGGYIPGTKRGTFPGRERAIASWCQLQCPSSTMVLVLKYPSSKLFIQCEREILQGVYLHAHCDTLPRSPNLFSDPCSRRQGQ